MTETERKVLDVSCTELEVKPVRDIDVNNRYKDTMDNKQSFLTELRHNKDTQSKVILSICVAFANSMLGWIKGQTGPAFLDILHISNTDLESGSAFMTSYYTGRAVGSILGGSLYSRVNRYLILVVSMSINCVTLALLPWCAQYQLMVSAHVIQGLCNGVMNVVLTAIAVSIWGASVRGRVYINIYMAAICPTGLLAPMATFPFLLPSSNDVASPLDRRNSSDNNINTMNSSLTERNVLKQNVLLHSSIAQTEIQTSNVYIAFSISAGLALLSTLPFVVIYFKTPKQENRERGSEESSFIGNLSISLKRLQLINIGMFAMFYMSLNFTFSGYLTAFCVQHLHWTKTSGALLTSVLFLTMLFGRIIGAYLSKFLTTMRMLVLSSLLHAVAQFGLAVSGVVLSDTGIWISVCIVGTVLSLMWPSLLSWTNENLISVRGKMSAFLLLIGFAGALSSPLLYGYMMEEVSPIWFCFLNFGKACILIINVILMFVHLRILRKSRQKHRNNEHIDS